MPLFNSRNNLTHLYYKINFMQLCKERALVREGSVYPKNGASMDVSISVLPHLVMKCTIQFIARINLILRVSNDAMLNGLSVIQLRLTAIK